MREANKERWANKWNSLQARLAWKLAQPVDMHEEVKADLAKSADRDLQIFHERRQAHSELRRTQQAARDIELAHRAREVRALEREARRREDFKQFNVEKLLSHYAALTDQLLDQEVAEAEAEELELRDSLRRTQSRMRSEATQQAFASAERMQYELEQHAALEAMKRAEAATRLQQATQARILHLRTGGRARLHG